MIYTKHQDLVLIMIFTKHQDLVLIMIFTKHQYLVLIMIYTKHQDYLGVYSKYIVLINVFSKDQDLFLIKIYTKHQDLVLIMGFNLICRLNLFAKKKLQTNQNISNLICWFVNFILQTLVSIEFVNSCSLQDWFHKHKLTCNTRMCLQHKFDKLCVSLPIKRNKIDWKGQ